MCYVLVMTESTETRIKTNIRELKTFSPDAPSGTPVEVLDHDFPIPGKGKAVSYGVYDINNNEGYVNVGIRSDTAIFAANSIRSWWYYMGSARFPSDSLEIIVNLIASTTTESGLHIECGLDFAEYKTGIKVTDEELSEINIVHNKFCGEWNHTIYPRY